MLVELGNYKGKRIVPSSPVSLLHATSVQHFKNLPGDISQACSLVCICTLARARILQKDIYILFLLQIFSYRKPKAVL